MSDSSDPLEPNKHESCVDAQFCPRCGESLPASRTTFTDDLVLNRYRTEFECPECGFHGEVFRHGE